MQLLGIALSVVFIGGLLFLLWVIARYSILSGLKLRGAEQRLRMPDVNGVEQLCGFRLPEGIASFFRDDEMVAMREFDLIDISSTPPKRWSVAGFEPLTPLDVREWRKVTGVPGVPIASEDPKGTYYITAEGTVRLQAPLVDDGDVLVAPTLGAFRAFTVAEPEGDEAD